MPLKFHQSIWLLLFAVAGAQAASDPVAHLLSRDAAPPGVVFEIVSGRDDYLETALPVAHDAARRLRERFPGLAVVIVTHGREQFALLEREAQASSKTHAKVRSLLADDVKVHVCGTYAGWRGHTAEDFPDYVDVAAAGPAQINDYRALGYELVLIDP